MPQEDPLGYYALLGVAPTARASVIRAAYRALAMELHPDRDKSKHATKQFQELQRAYDVLSDPQARAMYDASASGTSGASESQAPRARRTDDTSSKAEPYEPIRCKSCNCVTASPRYRAFWRVAGYVIGAQSWVRQGAYCSRCETLEGCKSTAITLVVGWWSINGFIWTLTSLYRNILGARAYREETARLLAHQVGHFLSVGNRPLALAVAHEALSTALRARNPQSAAVKMRAKLGYEQEDRLRELRENLQSFISSESSQSPGALLRTGTGMFGPAMYAQAAIVLAVGAAIVTWGMVEHARTIRKEEERLVEAGLQRDRAAEVARQKREALAASLQPLPHSGEYGAAPWRRFSRDLPPLKVNGSPDANFFLKVSDWKTGLPVLSIFVRAGEEVEVGVPPGSYSIKMASGSQWYGEEIRFGPTTDYSKIGTPSVFTQEGGRLLGHELTLRLMRDGNLRREPISASDF